MFGKTFKKITMKKLGTETATLNQVAKATSALSFGGYNGYLGRQDRRLDPFNRNSSLIEQAQIVPDQNNLASQIASQMNSQQGITNISGGKIINYLPKPTSISATVASNNGGGAASTDVYLFNNTSLTALDTDNGSGAASIAYTWGDGFSGRAYEKIFSSYNGGQGIGVRGFTIQITNFTTGASLGTLFNTMQLNMLVANAQGKMVPFTSDLAEAIRNSQYIAGTLTVIFPFVFNTLMQINYQQAANTTFAWTLITEYSNNLVVGN